MGLLEGKVAFITGAARGQGRSHALRLAQEGADIIAVDLCAQVDSIGYSLATPDDLVETANQVKALDRRIVATQVDVRDGAALKAAVDDGVAQLGRLDIVLANAGITGFVPFEEMTDEVWDDVIDINLSGAFKTVRAAVPHLKANENGGAIVLTSSVLGLKGMATMAHYTAAKHGLVGLMKTLANELAPHMIRVNSVHPGMVNTDMVQNAATYRLFRPDLENPGPDEVLEAFQSLQAMPIPYLESVDISNAIVWLVSDSARYVTGVQLTLDAGWAVK